MMIHLVKAGTNSHLKRLINIDAYDYLINNESSSELTL